MVSGVYSITEPTSPETIALATVRSGISPPHPPCGSLAQILNNADRIFFQEHAYRASIRVSTVGTTRTHSPMHACVHTVLTNIRC